MQKSQEFVDWPDPMYPCIIVNIGSGVPGSKSNTIFYCLVLQFASTKVPEGIRCFCDTVSFTKGVYTYSSLQHLNAEPGQCSQSGQRHLC